MLSFHVILKAPHLILLHMKSCTYHLAMSSCIILRIAFLVLIFACTFLVCAIWFFASRARVRAVRAGVRLHPWGGYRWFLYRWSDRRAHLLHLFYSFLLFALLLSLCCDSVVSRVLFHLFTDMSRVTLPLPTTCCLLFASLASRSALLGFVVISICSRYCCWVVDTCSFLMVNALLRCYN